MQKNSMQSQGIVMQQTPFQDFDYIVKIFTKDHGILNFFLKGSKRSLKQKQCLSNPFTELELVFYRTKGELLRIQETKVLDQNLHVRQKLQYMRLCQSFLQSLNKSQVTGKASPQLYRLLIAYIKQIDKVSFPKNLLSSFYLKSLIHEGILNLDMKCFQCQTPLQTHAHLVSKESYCHQHTPPSTEGIDFDEEQIRALHILAFTKSYAPLNQFSLSDKEHKNIKRFFDMFLD